MATTTAVEVKFKISGKVLGSPLGMDKDSVIREFGHVLKNAVEKGWSGICGIYSIEIEGVEAEEKMIQVETKKD